MPGKSLILVGFLLIAAGGWARFSSGDAPLEAATKGLSIDQRAAALALAQEHHPQLHALIRKLEKRNPEEYDKALAELSRTQERLSRQQTRDPERYAVELSLWKVDSRIRLLAARMANDERSSLEEQLRRLLDERTDLKLQQLALDRKRLEDRIERIDGQIRQLSSEREALVEKEVERLRKSVRSSVAK